MSRDLQESLRMWIEAVACGLVEPEDRGAVSAVVRMPAGAGVVVALAVPARSMPYVVGRRGSNADAIRTLTKAACRTLGWTGRVEVRIDAVGLDSDERPL